MENRDKNIFCPPAKIMILEKMRDKSRYCTHHKDFGHLTNDCRNLYKQIMFTIKKERITAICEKGYWNPEDGRPARAKYSAEGKSCDRAENACGRTTTKNGSDDSRSCYSQ